MKRKIPQETIYQVVRLYEAGFSGAHIMRETGLNSSSVIYRIINKYSNANRHHDVAGTFAVTIRLPEHIKELATLQEIQSMAVEFFKNKFPYSEIEGTSDNDETEIQNPPIAETTVVDEPKQETPKQKRHTKAKTSYSQNEGSDQEQPKEMEVFFYDEDDSRIARRVILTYPAESFLTLQLSAIKEQTASLREAVRAVVSDNDKFQIEIPL